MRGIIEVMANEQLITYDAGIQLFADKIKDTSGIRIGSFWEFIRDIWSKSYEKPELFNAWHVGFLAEKLEEAISKNLHFAAVLPRFHLKSTILGHGFSVYSFLKNSNSRFDSSILYLSFSDGMSQYHINEINKAVRRNEQIMEWIQDRSPEADYAFRYQVGNTKAEILHGGLFSFKRGMHVNRGMIGDDLLRDPDNPLNLSQLMKAEEHFFTESMYIPTKGVPVIIMGTPMAPNDMLAKLKHDERFSYVFLPALDPKPGIRVLCPEIRSETELLQEQATRPHAFASQMMLAPYLSTQAYINDEELREVENPILKSLNPYITHELDSDFTVAGFDVGKKRHPSHIVIYTSKGDKLTQVLQIYLDGWQYVEQVRFVNELVDNFGIDKGYIDNTDKVLEERGINSKWVPLAFTKKNKYNMAQIMEQYISGKKIEMVVDERQHSQIVSVDNELNAPETPLGHGDSFYSNALACLAHFETTSKGVSTIGDMQDVVKAYNEGWDQKQKIIFGNRQLDDQNLFEKCPNCGESKGWIPERKLCIICLYRGSKN